MAELLAAANYKRGVVPLGEVCDYVAGQTGLTVSRTERPAGMPESVLGAITFQPPVIELFPQDVEYAARARFTLAHELGHHQLGHGRYMYREVCEAEDLESEGVDELSTSDIARLEWQANRYASCILMPKAAFINAFRAFLIESGINDRGFGPLYLDHQPCNIRAFFTIASQLMVEFKVSKTAVRLRLVQLGLLIDKRKRQSSMMSLGNVMRRAPTL